jgi:hypothetical protein
MSARVLASAASLLLASCGLPSAPVSTAPTAATSGSAAAAPVASAAASAPASASASAAASAPAEPAASDPVVMELRKAMPEKTLTLRASGRIERVTTLPFAEDEERAPGRVAPASVEAFHAALRAARFCELAPKARESAPSYTIIEAKFPDVTCLIELPDTRWEKTPVAKKVIDAARRLEAEAFVKR